MSMPLRTCPAALWWLPLVASSLHAGQGAATCSCHCNRGQGLHVFYIGKGVYLNQFVFISLKKFNSSLYKFI